MGFSGGLYKYPKNNFNTEDDYYVKTYTIKELRVLEWYMSYETNEWTKEHYTTVEEYLRNYNHKSDFKPSENDLEWARNNLTKDEYGYLSFPVTLDDWCSSGAPLHDIFEQYSDDGVIDKDNLIKIIKEIFKRFEEYKFGHYGIQDAFVYSEDEDCTQKIVNIDGIRLYDSENDCYKDITTFDDGIITCWKYMETWSVSTYIAIFKDLINLLDFDFDNYYLVYIGG